MTEHGAGTIKEWMQELVEMARSGKEFETSAGAEPDRRYAYLEFRTSSDEDHSMLLFAVDEVDGQATVRAHHFRGTREQVREQVDRITHER